MKSWVISGLLRIIMTSIFQTLKESLCFQQVAFYNWTFKVGVKVPGN